MKVRGAKLLAVNQSTSWLFRELVESFCAHGVDVTLLAGYLERKEGQTPPFGFIQGTKLEKRPAWRRIVTWGKFALQAFVAMARHRDHFALLVTNPPLVPWLGPLAKWLFGVRYATLVYDIYPDIMVRMGMIRPQGVLHRILETLSAISHRHAECVITLGTHMRRTVLQHLRPGEAVNLHVIANWADVDHIRPMSHSENPFSIEHDLVDKFVVMYSGAFGATHDIESIIDAAEATADLPDVRFVLIGGGTREEEIRQIVADRALSNLLLLPFQPSEQVRFSLTAADCHIVSLDAQYAGISVPSKTYTALAAGATILAVTPEKTELEDLVEEKKCGAVIRPGNVEDLAAAVRRLRSDRRQLRQMQVRSREAAETEFCVEVGTAQYWEALGPLLAARNR